MREWGVRQRLLARIAALHYKTPLAEADSGDLYKELQDVSARLCKFVWLVRTGGAKVD